MSCNLPVVVVCSFLPEPQGSLQPCVVDPACDRCESFGGYGTYNGFTLTRNNIQRNVFSNDAFVTRKDVCCPSENKIIIQSILVLLFIETVNFRL